MPFVIRRLEVASGPEHAVIPTTARLCWLQTPADVLLLEKLSLRRVFDFWLSPFKKNMNDNCNNK